MTIVMYLYRDAFRLQSFGTASATAVILVIFIAVLAAINLYLTSGIGRKRKEVPVNERSRFQEILIQQDLNVWLPDVGISFISFPVLLDVCNGDTSKCSL